MKLTKTQKALFKYQAFEALFRPSTIMDFARGGEELVKKNQQKYNKMMNEAYEELQKAAKEEGIKLDE